MVVLPIHGWSKPSYYKQYSLLGAVCSVLNGGGDGVCRYTQCAMTWHMCTCLAWSGHAQLKIKVHKHQWNSVAFLGCRFLTYFNLRFKATCTCTMYMYMCGTCTCILSVRLYTCTCTYCVCTPTQVLNADVIGWMSFLKVFACHLRRNSLKWSEVNWLFVWAAGHCNYSLRRISCLAALWLNHHNHPDIMDTTLRRKRKEKKRKKIVIWLVASFPCWWCFPVV